MKLKQIFSFTIFVIVLTICINNVKTFFEDKYSDEKYKPFFENYKKTNFDVIFMGTSHTYNSVLSQEIWDIANITSYNWGSSCCTIPLDYYILKQICNYTTPKLVVIDLYGLVEYDSLGNGKYRPDILDQYRVQFDAFPLSKIKYEAVNDVFDDYDKRVDFLFNLAIYHNRWKEIEKDNFKPRDIPQFGSAFILGHKEVEYELYSGEKIEINSKCAEYIPKLCDFCNDNNIKILFTYLPFTPKESEVNVAYSFEDFLENYPDADYLNMLDLGILNYKTDMYVDGSHLNHMGAQKTTEFLANYLKNNYPELVSTDKKVIDFWNAKYEDYVEYKISRFQENNLYDNLELAYGNDFKIKISVLKSYKESFNQDSVAQNFISEFENDAEINFVDQLNDTDAKLKLEVISKDTDEVVFETIYSY